LESFHKVILMVYYFISEFKLRVGLDIPTVEVRFEHLNVEAKVHVGSRALPTIYNFFINMFEVN
jgi:hypothetical protein